LSSSPPDPGGGLAALSRLERRLLPRALITVVVASVRLRATGLERTQRRMAGPDRPVPPDADERVTASTRVVWAVIRRIPYARTCLPRSVALWALLRRQGIDSEVVIGVRPGGAPLDAHAWVERAGVPLNERPDIVASYSRMEPGTA
jgi:hypothetical protein